MKNKHTYAHKKIKIKTPKQQKKWGKTKQIEVLLLYILVQGEEHRDTNTHTCARTHTQTRQGSKCEISEAIQKKRNKNINRKLNY